VVVGEYVRALYLEIPVILERCCTGTMAYGVLGNAGRCIYGLWAMAVPGRKAYLGAGNRDNGEPSKQLILLDAHICQSVLYSYFLFYHGR
jgi:hypothetical protein